MSYQKCLDAIERAAGRPLSTEEMDDLLTGLQERTQMRLALGDDPEAAAKTAAKEYSQDMAAAAMIEKRNAALSLKTFLESLDKINSQFSRNKVLGLESVLTGVNNAAKGSRNSAALAQDVLQNYYKIGLATELRREGLQDIYNSGAMDREISKALWANNRATPKPVDVPAEAVKIAEIIAKWQEVSRQDANKAGAWIKKLEGYITRQSHDSFKIKAAGYEAWRDYIVPKLDMARTLAGDKNADAFLRGAWEGLASGVHLKTADQSPSGFKGPRNIAKKASAERVLHFRDSDAWFDYNEEFGVGSLRESVNASLSRMAQDTGLMRVLGPNPEANLNRLTEALTRAESDPDKRAKLSTAANGVLKNRFAEVSGLTRMPVNHIWAKRSATIRAVQNMAKLGGAIASQLGDIAVYGSEMRYQGRTMLSGMAESLAAVGKGLQKKERNDLYGMLGVYFESMGGNMVDRFSLADDGLPGGIAKAQQLFFKLNLMRWWSESQRASAVMAFSHYLARNADANFAEINPDLRRTLGMFGINDADWSVIRKAVTTAEDGRAYVTPETIADRQIADKVRAYFVDRASFAQLNPDARTRSVINQGTRPGTIAGEFDRFLMQFKSFSVATVQKTLGREIYGRGAAEDATLWQALRNGNGEILGLANVIVYSTLMGYGAMTAKELIKGRSPRVPEEPKDIAKVLMASMVQGGGLGLYGDFLFGEANRFGGGIVASAAGPTIGSIEDLHGIWNTLMNPDADDRARDAAAKAFKFALNNTPFANLFYTRVVFDYLIGYGMQEALSPGYLRRMEKRVKRENNQEFLMRPSQHANQF